jgi:hypothetical protein|nr:MAG TPA: hypothetical protein [Caudoviricetes sp.]
MNDLSKILEYVRKTNPEMTEEKLIKILKNINPYEVSALQIISSQKNFAGDF